MYIFSHGHVTHRDHNLIVSGPWLTFSHCFAPDRDEKIPLSVTFFFLLIVTQRGTFGDGFAPDRDKKVTFWSRFCSLTMTKR